MKANIFFLAAAAMALTVACNSKPAEQTAAPVQPEQPVQPQQPEPPQQVQPEPPQQPQVPRVKYA